LSGACAAGRDKAKHDKARQPSHRLEDLFSRWNLILALRGIVGVTTPSLIAILSWAFARDWARQRWNIAVHGRSSLT
jgi:hypothetical protein